jgi:hypothetical protein
MMERLDIKGNEFGGIDAERTTRRIVNGVEILERESIGTIRLQNGAYVNSGSVRLPRLVVSDAINRSKLFITKSRAQLGDIDAFIRNISRKPAEVK